MASKKKPSAKQLAARAAFAANYGGKKSKKKAKAKAKPKKRKAKAKAKPKKKRAKSQSPQESTKGLKKGAQYIGLDGVARVADGVRRCGKPSPRLAGFTCGHATPCPWHPARPKKKASSSKRKRKPSTSSSSAGWGF